MIAYLLLAHADDDQLRLLVDTLLTDSRSRVFLHLDARLTSVSRRAWTSLHERLVELPSSRVRWAGFSMVQATMALLEAGLAQADNEFFVLLSGTSFPLRPMAAINDALGDPGRPDAVPIWKRVLPPDRSTSRREADAIRKFHFMDLELSNPQRSKMWRHFWALFNRVNAALPYSRDAGGPVVKGSQWFGVGRTGANRFVIEGRRLTPVFRYGFAPDEMLFQTIYYRAMLAQGHVTEFIPQFGNDQGLHLIPFRPVVGRNWRERLREAPDPRALSLADLDWVVDSPALFARKCSLELSRGLLQHTA